MQFQADILEVPIVRPQMLETTALGAAYLAGVQLGVYESLADISSYWQRDALFTPRIGQKERDNLLRGWEKAIARVLETKVEGGPYD
jgi:glycerol kinase